MNKNKNQHHCYGAPRTTIKFITAIFVVIGLFCLSLSSKSALSSSNNNNKSSLLHVANHHLDENTSSNERRTRSSSRNNNNEDQQQQQQQSQSSVSLLYNSPNEIPMNIINKLDVILVLGGGKPKSIHHPPLYVEKRCDDAIEILSRRRRRRTGKTSGDISSNRRRNTTTTNNNELAILCLSAGTAHLSQLLSLDGLPIWESTACASYILSKMKESEEIYVETTSYDTIGNAFYARTSHTDIMKNWNTLLIITNEFHMERTQKIFNWIYSLDNNDDEGSSSTNYELYFLQSPNIGLSSEAITARKQREHQSSIYIDQLVQEKTTLQQVYQFLTKDHSLYTAQYLIDRGSQQEQQQQSENKLDSEEEEEDVVKDNVKLSYGM
ncbi:hypothetical protein FRACYDRAFT_194788 [Fragilariopsis cylindrus CCMP1102]|uniref:DUF218 domain-containing protein n=1 Tax=Fragilariopsis cylindrus CCMP1102 TaxID=635003 RepID=A0A1E7EVB9_9STRA|nr:hypothetical protein FRACYDRAFT_194788 [Fragilariopsis cylindrus CCMP1102]|eukprot:OEU09797.1 hypothetical protein FRACYDRAFT_194788 [Fragilariopsis cylindrus CCMP1102]